MKFYLSLFCFLVVFPLTLARAESPPTPEPILRIEPGMHTAIINRMGVSRDGRLLATGSDDKTVRLWALPAHGKGPGKKPLKPKLIRTLRVPIGPGNDGKIYALALSPDGRMLAAGGWMNTKGDEYIYLFDTVSGALTGRLGPLKNVINDLAFSRDGRRLAAGLGTTNGVRVWQINEKGQKKRRLVLKDTGFGDNVYGLDWDQNGRLAATSDDGFVRLYEPVGEAASGTLLVPSPTGGGSGWGAGMSKCAPVPSTNTRTPHPGPLPSKTEMGEGGRRNTVRPLTGKDKKQRPCYRLLAKKKAPGGKRPYGISFSPDGKRLAIGYDDSTRVDVLDGVNLEKRFSLDTSSIDNGNLGNVAWSRDGRALVAAGRYQVDGKYLLLRWDHLQSGDKNARGQRRALPGPLSTVFDLAPAANGGVLFSAGDPAFGLVGKDGKRALHQGPVTVDMRGKRYEHFTVSPDAMHLRFGFKEWGEEPYLFDLARLQLMTGDGCKKTPSPTGGGLGRGAPVFECGSVSHTDTGTPHPGPLPMGEGGRTAPPGNIRLHQADTTSLPIKKWLNNRFPTLSGKRLNLKQYERSRSLAIALDHKSFVLGTEWKLRRYDDKGALLWKKAVPGVVWGVNLSVDGKIIVTAYGDGTIRWHRASDGEELLALFVHVPDKSWVLWTPSGYFTASPGGEELIGWHVNRGWDEAADFFPASKFRKRFYRPDVVALMLKVLDEKKAVAAADKAAGNKPRSADTIAKNLPPVIDIVSRITSFDKGSLTLEYRLRNPSKQKILNVEVLIDGRPWKGRGFVPEEREITAGLRKITIKLPPRDVSVSLVARTRDTTSVRATLALQWTGKKAVQTELPRLFALLVGISDYKDNSLDLNYADDDAIALEKMFKAQEGRIYRKVTTKLLIDKQASRGNILRQLNWLRKQAKAGDVVVISMAGHGYTDATQFFHFLPHEADPAEPIIDGISNASITAMIARMTAKVVVFMDACHAGDGVTSTVNMSRMSGEMKDAGAIFYAASTGSQLSQESADWGHGAFTYALLQGLGGSADYDRDPPKGIDTAELNLWLTKKVVKLTNGDQRPVMIKSAVPDFVLASGK